MDRAAVAGDALYLETCVQAGANESFLHCRFRGTGLDATGTPAEVAPDDYLRVKAQPEVAAAELGRSSGLGEMARYFCRDHPPDLRAYPPQLTGKPVDDWSVWLMTGPTWRAVRTGCW